MEIAHSVYVCMCVCSIGIRAEWISNNRELVDSSCLIDINKVFEAAAQHRTIKQIRNFSIFRQSSSNEHAQKFRYRFFGPDLRDHFFGSDSHGHF